ncbi:MAG TPA: aminoacyl-tRNA hydrolase [Polyangiales bacterium]|jgi:PTH1 family peptidyl-tRNA hydrolase|nr:aminoacyl-tRNA hydrolase [Polyangiales bacterium]
MLLIVGLGNPGAKYARHRHNVGFMVVQELAQRFGAEAFREKFSGRFAKARVDSHDVVLLEPQTFMNLSGESVQKAMAFFKLGLPDLLVIHDELDHPFGTLKLKQGGGAAGHNGLKSIMSCCGGPDFARLRVGIGRPRSGAPEHHVLSDFSKDECAVLGDVLERASLAAADVVRLGVAAAMNRHNQTAKS